MSMLNDIKKEVEKRTGSSSDSSGTSPNRYDSSNTVADAERKSELITSDRESFIPGLKVNVSTIERALMVAAGGYLLYSGLSGRNKSAAKSVTAAAMLARGISGYCPAYDAADKLSNAKNSNVNIRTSINIDKPVDEVYDFWRKLENLPKFMAHLKIVEETSETKSHWTAKGPAGIGTISWDAEILTDEPGKVLSWRSLPGSTIDNAGKVAFRKNGEGGTELDVMITYRAPMGVAGESAAKLLNPYFENMVTSDIENLKTYLETGKNVEA